MSVPPKIKILHTTTRLVLGGGVEKNIFYTIQGLRNEFEFHLSTGVDCQDTHFAEEAGCKLIVCPSLINSIHPIKDLQAIWFYYKLIKKERYQIVHTHETKASLITRIAAWLAGCPYIIYGLHGVTFNDPMSKVKRNFFIWIEKLTVGFAHRIVSVGQQTIDAYHQAGIAQKMPYDVVRSGIDINTSIQSGLPTAAAKAAFRERLGFTTNDVVLITVGRFSFSKAQRYAIEAFALLYQQFPHCKLVLVGEGELLPTCKAQAVALGLPDHSIVFAGYQQNIPEWLSASDIFLFTSLREGLPRVLVEASIQQLPVVTFEVEGAREVLENDVSGYIVPQYNVSALVSATAKLIVDAGLRQQMAQKAYQHVVKQWDIQQMTDRLRSIYLRSN